MSLEQSIAKTWVSEPPADMSINEQVAWREGLRHGINSILESLGNPMRVEWCKEHFSLEDEPGRCEHMHVTDCKIVRKLLVDDPRTWVRDDFNPATVDELNRRAANWDGFRPDEEWVDH